MDDQESNKKNVEVMKKSKLTDKTPDANTYNTTVCYKESSSNFNVY